MTHKTKLQTKPLACLLLGLIPISAYYFLVTEYSVNIPFADDYRAILGFMISFFEADDLGEKISLIFSQHNEHRIVLTRLLGLVSYYLLDEVNFAVLTIIGNTSILALAIILFNCFRVTKNKLYYFLPVLLILFQPQAAKNMFYPMCSIQNFYIVVFSLLYVHLIANNTGIGFYFSLLIYVIAVFTSGSGIFLFLVGSGILLYQTRHRHALIHLFLFLFMTFAYFCDYHQPHSPSLLAPLLHHPFKTVLFCLHLLGSCSGFTSHAKYFTLFLGAFFIAYFVFLIRIRYYRKNVVLFSGFIYLMMSVSLIAINRVGLYNEHVFLSSLDGRYRIYSYVFLALSIMSFAEIMDKEKLKTYFGLVISISVVFCALSYIRYYEPIRNAKYEKVRSLIQWERTKDPAKLPVYSAHDYANEVISLAIRKNYYYLPKDVLKNAR